MKFPFNFLRGRSFSDLLGFLALLLLMTGIAFHFNINKDYVYYREIFAILFAGLWAWRLLILTRFFKNSKLRINPALFYIALFPALLILWSFIDPQIPLYIDRGFDSPSEYINSSNLYLYVLRNAFLYIPMVLYFSVRGVNEKEVYLIATFMILIAPFSINAYLESEKIATLATLGQVAELSSQQIAYNSYTPFLTFPVLCGIYILFSRVNIIVKAIVLLCAVVVGIFILFSLSRQSVLYVILCLGAFFYFNNQKTVKSNKWLFIGVFSVVGFSMFSYFIQGFELSESFVRRFSSVQGFFTSAQRSDTVLEGLLLLKPMDWLIGAGLTSVIDSGPHNDYVRWTQRVGVILMMIGFVPFFITFWKSYKLMVNTKSNNNLYIFLALAIAFTLFHSLFGYPREDAQQAPCAFLGLALWFGALREGLFNNKQCPAKNARQGIRTPSHSVVTPYNSQSI